GKTLGDHLAAKPVGIAPADSADRTATDAFATGRIRAQRLARGARYGALAVFFALFAVAGGAVMKRWSGGGAAPSRDPAASSGEKIPRSAARGAERNPATDTTAEKTLPSTTIPAVAAAGTAGATAPTAATAKAGKGKARTKPAVLRQARA